MRGQQSVPREAIELQRLLRQHLGHDQVVVEKYGDHMVIDVLTPWGQERIARLTPIGRGHYGLGFRSHTGRWVALPYTGPLKAMAKLTAEQLGGHLDPENYANWDLRERCEF